MARKPYTTQRPPSPAPVPRTARVVRPPGHLDGRRTRLQMRWLVGDSVGLVPSRRRTSSSAASCTAFAPAASPCRTTVRTPTPFPKSRPFPHHSRGSAHRPHTQSRRLRIFDPPGACGPRRPRQPTANSHSLRAAAPLPRCRSRSRAKPEGESAETASPTFRAESADAPVCPSPRATLEPPRSNSRSRPVTRRDGHYFSGRRRRVNAQSANLCLGAPIVGSRRVCLPRPAVREWQFRPGNVCESGAVV